MSKKRAIWVARFGLSIILLYLLYSRIDFKKIETGLFELGWLVAPAYLLSWLGSFFLPAIVVWRLGAVEKRIPLRTFIVINHVNRLYSLAMPFAVAVGAKFLQYVDAGVSKKHSVALLAANRAANMLIAFAGIVVTGLMVRVSSDYPRWSAAVAGASLISLVLIFSVTYWLSSGDERAGKGLLGKLRQVISSAAALCVSHALFILTLTLVANILLVLGQWLLLIDLGQTISFSEIFWARSILSLVLMLPISVAGIGFRDVSLVATLGIFGIAPSQAALLAFVLLMFQVTHGVIGFLLEQTQLFSALRDRKKEGRSAP